MKSVGFLAAAVTVGLTSAAEPRIVNGDVVSVDAYPYMVSLQQDGSHFCGGSLIRAEAPALVLTAAHCFETNYTMENNTYQYIGDRPFTAVLGRDDVKGPSDDNTYTTVNVNWVKVHADYTGDLGQWNDSLGLNYADVAILSLDGAVSGFDEVILYDMECCDSNSNFTIMGYGTNYSGGPLSPSFEIAEQYYVSIEECQRWYAYNWLSNISNSSEALSIDFMSSDYDYLDDFPLTFIGEGQVCGYSVDDEDTCQGDSGGPMIFEDTSVQAGVVSWGFGCASVTPGVYADVSYFHDWIASASACLTVMDTFSMDAAETCDELCMYENSNCTHFADVTTEEPTTTTTTSTTTTELLLPTTTSTEGDDDGGDDNGDGDDGTQDDDSASSQLTLVLSGLLGLAVSLAAQ